jgi:large subunit ribosomal protein L15
MRIDELKAPPGARRNRKRIGRGNGSQGTYSGKGMKGQKARSGSGAHRGFEGGQLPLIKRLPSQRGFTNIFKKIYEIVNVDTLDERFVPGSEVTVQSLKDANIINGKNPSIKILGRGEITKSLTVNANKFTSEAKRKIEEAGGRVVEA